MSSYYRVRKSEYHKMQETTIELGLRAREAEAANACLKTENKRLAELLKTAIATRSRGIWQR